MGFIRDLLRLATPPCDECSHYGGKLGTGKYKCLSPAYAYYLKRVNSRDFNFAYSEDVRGTRFCTFEEKQENKGDDDECRM